MLKGANQRKSQPVPAAWSSVLMAVKIIEEEKEKKFGGGWDFLLKLDLVQLARRGGFLNTCET